MPWLTKTYFKQCIHCYRVLSVSIKSLATQRKFYFMKVSKYAVFFACKDLTKECWKNCVRIRQWKWLKYDESNDTVHCYFCCKAVNEENLKIPSPIMLLYQHNFNKRSYTAMNKLNIEWAGLLVSWWRHTCVFRWCQKWIFVSTFYDLVRVVVNLKHGLPYCILSYKDLGAVGRSPLTKGFYRAWWYVGVACSSIILYFSLVT